MPAVLQKLMRHESIETAMTFYVDLDTDDLAETVWKRHEAEKSTVSRTVADSDEQTSDDKEGLNRVSIDG